MLDDDDDADNDDDNDDNGGCRDVIYIHSPDDIISILEQDQVVVVK